LFSNNHQKQNTPAGIERVEKTGRRTASVSGQGQRAETATDSTTTGPAGVRSNSREPQPSPEPERRRPAIIKHGMYGGNAAAKNAALQLPSFTGKDPDYTDDDLWTSKIEDKDIVVLLRRNGLARSISEAWPRSVGGKPPAIMDDVKGKLAAEIDSILTPLDFWGVHQSWYRQKRDRATALLALGWQDGMARDDLEFPTADILPGIDYIHVITRDQIFDIVEDRDPRSETYGTVTHYILNVPKSVGDGFEQKRVHASRFLRWTHPSPDNNKWGMSQFLPFYNDLRGLSRMMDAMYQTVRRTASKVIYVTHPENVTDDALLDEVEEQLKNIDTDSVLILRGGFVPNAISTADTLDPSPYFEAVIDLIAASGLGNRVILMGSNAGQLEGSEVNERQFALRVADEQENVYGAKAREFIDLLRAKGIIKSPGNYWLEFPPIRQLDEKELAEMGLKDSQKFSTTILALKQAMPEAQFSLAVDDDGIVKLTTEDLEIPVPGLNARKRAHAPAAGVNASYPKLSPDEKKKMYDEWELKSADIEADLLESFNTHYGAFRKDFQARLKDAWGRHIGPADVGTNAVRYAQNDEVDLVKEMGGDIPTAALEAEVAASVEAGYHKGMTDTEVLMQWELTEAAALEGDPALRALQSRGGEMARGTLMEGNRRGLRAIREGFEARESYAQMADRVGKALGKPVKDFPNTTQKIAHTAMAEGRWETLERHGHEYGVWLSAGDDGVRTLETAPASHRIDGTRMTRAESMHPHYLSAYGCRCTLIPESPYQRALERMRALQPQGVVA